MKQRIHLASFISLSGLPTPRANITQPLIRLSLTLMFLVMLWQEFGIAQQPSSSTMNEEERVVGMFYGNLSPLKLKVIKTKKGEFSLRQKFIDKDDWLQGLSVVLENTSDKTITYIGAGFLFPRPEGEGRKQLPYYKSLFYGHHPDAPGESVLNVQPLALKAGERITITLSDSEYLKVLTILKELEYVPSIKTVKFGLQEIYFDDGTGWPARFPFRRDPEGTFPERQ